jgi:hypothetical protein
MRKKSLIAAIVLVCAAFLFVAGVNAQVSARATAPPPNDGSSVVVAPTIVDYHSVRDNYGKSVASRSLVVQVTVSNSDPNASLQVFSLAGIFDPNECHATKEFWAKFAAGKCETLYRKYFAAPAAYAPRDLRQVIADQQVGETNSLRSRVFRGLDAVVLVGSSLTALRGATALTILSATGIPALRNVWPDMSPAQLQRIMDHGMQPVIINPSSSQTFVIFLPASSIFTKDTWALYTATAQTNTTEALEFKRAMQLFVVVQVDGAKITRSQPVTATSAQAPAVPSPD